MFVYIWENYHIEDKVFGDGERLTNDDKLFIIDLLATCHSVRAFFHGACFQFSTEALVM